MLHLLVCHLVANVGMNRTSSSYDLFDLCLTLIYRSTGSTRATWTRWPGWASGPTRSVTKAFYCVTISLSSEVDLNNKESKPNPLSLLKPGEPGLNGTAGLPGERGRRGRKGDPGEMGPPGSPSTGDNCTCESFSSARTWEKITQRLYKLLLC